MFKDNSVIYSTLHKLATGQNNHTEQIRQLQTEHDKLKKLIVEFLDRQEAKGDNV